MTRNPATPQPATRNPKHDECAMVGVSLCKGGWKPWYGGGNSVAPPCARHGGHRHRSSPVEMYLDSLLLQISVEIHLDVVGIRAGLCPHVDLVTTQP